MSGPGSKNPFFSGFLTGLFSGLGLAIAVALLITRSNPFVDSPEPAGPAAGGAVAPMEAPRMDFDVPLPAPAPQGAVSADVQATGYFLQAGAFQNAAEAEQMKARLALLGFESRILQVPGAEAPLYKVQTGPYKAPDELNAARARLTQGGIDTIMVRISPPDPSTPQVSTQETP